MLVTVRVGPLENQGHHKPSKEEAINHKYPLYA